MATTNIDVCNFALSELDAETITALDPEESREARLCAAIYPVVRKAALSRLPSWRWATKTAELTRKAGTAPDGWEYWYQLPGDYLAAQRTDEKGEAWDVFGQDGEAVLVTRRSEATIHYTSDVDEAVWPSQFVRAVALDMAGALAYAITKTRTLKDSFKEEAEYEYARAVGQDQSARTGEAIVSDGGVASVRYYGRESNRWPRFTTS